MGGWNLKLNCWKKQPIGFYSWYKTLRVRIICRTFVGENLYTLLKRVIFDIFIDSTLYFFLNWRILMSKLQNLFNLGLVILLYFSFFIICMVQFKSIVVCAQLRQEIIILWRTYKQLQLFLKNQVDNHRCFHHKCYCKQVLTRFKVEPKL